MSPVPESAPDARIAELALSPPPAPRADQDIAVISLSSSAVRRFPLRAARAAEALATTFGRHVRMSAEDDAPGVVAGSTASRARALHDALADPDVGLVMFSVGGYNANDVLADLAGRAPALAPKPLVGYSDSTAALVAYQSLTGSVVFYGPAALPQFGEYPAPFPESVRSLTDVVLDGRPRRWEWPGWYTQSDVDWAEDEQFARSSYGPSGPRVLRAGRARGRLQGGNVPTLNLLAGTPWFPAPDGPVVLALEGVADAGRPEAFRRGLRHLGHAGLLERAVALLIGRTPVAPGFPRRLEDLAALVLDVLPGDVPILADVPFGHVDPILTLPLGAVVEVVADPGGPSVRTLTPTVSAPAPADRPAGPPTG